MFPPWSNKREPLDDSARPQSGTVRRLVAGGTDVAHAFREDASWTSDSIPPNASGARRWLPGTIVFLAAPALPPRSPWREAVGICRTELRLDLAPVEK